MQTTTRTMASNYNNNKWQQYYVKHEFSNRINRRSKWRRGSLF